MLDFGEARLLVTVEINADKGQVVMATGNKTGARSEEEAPV